MQCLIPCTLNTVMPTQYVLQLVILSASAFGLNGVPVPVLPAAITQKLLYQLQSFRNFFISCNHSETPLSAV